MNGLLHWIKRQYHLTINAVDPVIGAKIYKFVDFMGTRFTGKTGAAILLANQLAGLKYLTSHGIVCKVNTVVLSGINENHIESVVKKAKELGCYITNIMQLIPVQGSAFETLPQVSNKKIMEMRKQCEGTIKQMYHCKQCRADAIGTLGNDLSICTCLGGIWSDDYDCGKHSRTNANHINSNLYCSAIWRPHHVKKRTDYSLEIPDWNVTIKTEKKVPDGLKFAGVRAHYFVRVYDGSEPNTIKGTVSRIIEDTFSIIVMVQCDSSTNSKGQIRWEFNKESDHDLMKIGQPVFLKIMPKDILMMEK